MKVRTRKETKKHKEIKILKAASGFLLRMHLP